MKGALAAIHLSCTIITSGGHLQWSSIFKGTVSLLNKHLELSLFYRYRVNLQVQCSHPFFQIYCVFAEQEL